MYQSKLSILEGLKSNKEKYRFILVLVFHNRTSSSPTSQKEKRNNAEKTKKNLFILSNYVIAYTFV